MKRYLLFKGDIYYARGGMYDFVADGSGTVELMNILDEQKHNNSCDDYEWWYIYDTKNREHMVHLNNGG